MTKKQKKMLARILVCAVMLIALQFLPITRIPRFALYLAAYLVIGFDILKKAAKGIGNGRVFDENFLMAVATIESPPRISGAFCPSFCPISSHGLFSIQNRRTRARKRSFAGVSAPLSDKAGISSARARGTVSGQYPRSVLSHVSHIKK